MEKMMYLCFEKLNCMVSDIIKNIAVVGAGSFIGGAVRYLVSLVMNGIGKGFPWATLAVNLVGCFLIGLLWSVFSKNATGGGGWALFLTVGLCGGFTTFSTFSKEALMMLQAGNVWGFVGYVAISVVVGIALVALGYIIAR
jgi:CrcB protein